MNRYEQRRQKRLQNPEFAASYWTMEAELQLVHAIEVMGEHQQANQKNLLEHMEEISSAIETLIELFSALNITADITLRQAEEGESPIQVATELLPYLLLVRTIDTVSIPVLHT